jgi:pyrimidine operon attenuation protein / uracil phosphoribosyltransferase
MHNKVVVLDKVHIAHKLRRMAYEVWEHNSEEQEVIIIGIERAGRVIADALAAILKEVSPLQTTVLSLTINKRELLDELPPFGRDLTNASVVLVDDVANSGKTLVYALKPLLQYDVKKLMTAVLVDRKHKRFPIASDIVGLSIATTLQEHIEVEIVGNEVNSVYLQ